MEIVTPPNFPKLICLIEESYLPDDKDDVFVSVVTEDGRIWRYFGEGCLREIIAPEIVIINRNGEPCMAEGECD